MDIRKENKIKPKVVLSIEGNTGSGKTTFLSLLRDRCGMHPLFEPEFDGRHCADQFGNLLKLFYNDSSRWGLTFQTYILLRRTVEYLEALRNFSSKSGIVVMDRSVYADYHCFAKVLHKQGKITAFEWEIYCKIFSWITEYFTLKPSGIIYLRASSATCRRRVALRGREEEKMIDLSFIESIGKSHDEWLLLHDGVNEHLSGAEVLLLDGELDFEKDPKIFQSFADQVIALSKRVCQQHSATSHDEFLRPTV